MRLMRDNRQIKDEMSFFRNSIPRRKAYLVGLMMSDCHGFGRMLSRLENDIQVPRLDRDQVTGMGMLWKSQVSKWNSNYFGLNQDYFSLPLFGTYVFITHFNTISPLI